MKVLELGFIWGHYGSFFSPFNPTASYSRGETLFNPPKAHSYARFSEIKEHCGSILTSASKLEPDGNRAERMKRELLFLNGDWDQESSKSPLMPFDDRRSYVAGEGASLKLASFWVTDVSSLRHAKNAISVSGVLRIGITKGTLFFEQPLERSPSFSMWRGFTELTIPFEGIYVESQENGGKQVMYLFGNAEVPLNQFDEYYVSNNQKLVYDDQIILFLQYPKIIALATRGINGEMKRLNKRSSLAYFDEVHISSQLGSFSKYQFGSEELLSRVCSPYPFPNYLIDEEIGMFKGEDFCEKLRDSVHKEVFKFVPGEDNMFDPFVFRREVEATIVNMEDFELIVQHLLCEPGDGQIEIKRARVAAVFWVFHSDYAYRQQDRTGLSERILSAEGMWRSSHGQLCMVRFLGLAGTPSE